MECPICFEHYEDESLQFECNSCKKKYCLFCVESISNDSCPFCRYSSSLPQNNSFTNHSDTIHPSSAPSSTSHHNIIYNSSLSFPSINHEWHQSRIMMRQIRRERKRIDHEAERRRNAELSRIHNHEQRRPPSRQEKRSDLLFDIDDL